MASHQQIAQSCHRMTSYLRAMFLRVREIDRANTEWFDLVCVLSYKFDNYEGASWDDDAANQVTRSVRHAHMTMCLKSLDKIARLIKGSLRMSRIGNGDTIFDMVDLFENMYDYIIDEVPDNDKRCARIWLKYRADIMHRYETMSRFAFAPTPNVAGSPCAYITRDRAPPLRANLVGIKSAFNALDHAARSA